MKKYIACNADELLTHRIYKEPQNRPKVLCAVEVHFNVTEIVLFIPELFGE